LVLVHGGSADIDRLATRLGVPNRRLVSPDGVSARWTDAAMAEVVHLALAGLAKPRLVEALVGAGVPALGLTGLDAGLVTARRKPAVRAVVDGRRVVVRDNRSGRIVAVRPEPLLRLLAAGLLPVLSPPVFAEGGGVLNVDADRMAAAVAAAVGADRLIMLTGAPGLLADPDDHASVLSSWTAGEDLPGFARGGMGLKLVAAREALTGGVGSVTISAGHGPEPIGAALAGAGTSVNLRTPALLTAVDGLDNFS
jgi:acetylglutamate/LysW-gamma-L-alpha-aminoadipate kinase